MAWLYACRKSSSEGRGPARAFRHVIFARILPLATSGVVFFVVGARPCANPGLIWRPFSPWRWWAPVQFFTMAPPRRNAGPPRPQQQNNFARRLVEHGGEGAAGSGRRLQTHLQELRQWAGLDQRDGGRICRHVLHKAAPGLRRGCRRG